MGEMDWDSAPVFEEAAQRNRTVAVETSRQLGARSRPSPVECRMIAHDPLKLVVAEIQALEIFLRNTRKL
jgi:hypothetical protein